MPHINLGGDMSRMDDSEREARDAVRREIWSLRGLNQVVKVVSADAKAAPTLGGYITTARSLLDRRLEEIVADLGLRKDKFERGARVYRFTRLPQPSEYEYDLTADFPSGLVYNPGHVKDDEKYPAGSPTVHQWKIRPGVEIPVDPKSMIEVKPGEKIPYSWFA
jgi:hypothetical protein